MPRMDEPNDSDTLVKLLLVGDGKVGKTHYAGMAAAAGLNVFYFDGDVGRPTLASLPLEARKRIYAIDCADTIGGGVKDSRFFDTFKEFGSNVVFKWNDTRSRIASGKVNQPGDELWEVRPANMDHTCVFVLDSWTGLSESMMTRAGNANSVDLANATTSEMRPVYQAGGLQSMWALQVIRSMRCHVIVLAHPDEFSHTTKPDGRKVKDIKETELTVDWTKMIPKSTSKPNSLQMAKYFTDIGWAGVNAVGDKRMIDFRMDEGKMSGGHFTERKDSTEYSFGNLIKMLGGKIQPDAGVDHWLKITHVTENGQMPADPIQVLDGTKQTTMSTPSGGGMASLFKKASTPA